MNENLLSTMIDGVDSSVSTAAKQALEKSIRNVSDALEAIQLNRSSSAITSKDPEAAKRNLETNRRTLTDAEVYTNISELINGNQTDPAGFSSLLESLYAKNKKGYAILKDYELMPILIPQINRVLMFLVNECLSPDIQNKVNFVIKYTGADSDPYQIQKDIDSIKKEMKLDALLREVYTNRFRLGREYYAVIDYSKTFDRMLDTIQRKRLNETSSGEPPKSDLEYLNETFAFLTETIDDIGCQIRINALSESPERKRQEELDIVETTVDLNFDHMNIVVERSSIAHRFEDVHAALLTEAYSSYTADHLMDQIGAGNLSLNEAVVDSTKMEQLIQTVKKKKLQRCTIDRFDPAKIFKLKVGGKVVGYFHITDITEGSAMLVNFAQALKDQLLKSRATNLNAAVANAEEIISKSLAERIINKFDPNIGINRVEDIDLLHDFIRNNEVYRGNKRITFYYEDEIIDLSRADDSILINAVFFTKLYATLLLNNIMTKVLRGRGRQIHTIQMGASPSIQRYLQNAMAALTMPENNLGTLHGSFEQILNPFNSASDIVIPTEDSTERYITTDYIPGQDVDMNDDFLRFLLNSIVTSFGLDSAVIDTTNGNLQFARTWTMESLQICSSVRNEQQDIIDAWESLCLKVLSIMGNENTRNAVERGNVEVSLFEPKTLIIQNIIDDLNNAKSYAEAIADIVPQFNQDNTEAQRNKFVYRLVKDNTNLNWTKIEELISEVKLDVIPDELEAQIAQLIQEYQENVKTQTYGDTNGDGIVTDADQHGDEYGGLTAEEEDLMSSPDEEF